MPRQPERRMGVEALSLREASDAVTLTGYASTFGQPYDMGWYTESVDHGAFRETLGRRPDVRLLVNHDGLPLARTTSGTLQLDTDSRGLRVSASLDPSDPDVASLVPKMRRGDLNQMSFGFRCARNGDEWSADMTQRTLRNLDLNDGDVSVVTYPANPSTSAGVRGDGPAAEAVASAMLEMERRGASSEQMADLLQRVQRALQPPAVIDDAMALAQGVDASLDEAMNLLRGVDQDSLPDEVAQALDLVTAAWATAGKTLEAMHADDPDDRSAATEGAQEPQNVPDPVREASLDAFEARRRAFAAL